ncbi:isocitrate dehydrogenase [Anaplasma marginale str. Dawn]|nr:isocitrate dehydrogenase [Anaplasma marginale str. Gypsy Plains]AGZ79961.1 isocitrate dehydrogenase [Anaplasma marginale str. Dawn]
MCWESMSVPITVAYGDGVGPEIMEAVLFILKEARADVSIETVDIGHNQYKKEWTSGIAPSAWESISRTRLLLKAPTMTPQGSGHKSLNVALRQRLGLYVNVRPCVSYFPVVGTKHPDLDVVIIRENEEDTYSGVEHKLSEDTHECVKISTRSASEKICAYAFNYARAHNRKKVTCFVKDNIMKMTDGILHASFDKVAKGYPDIEANYYIVDVGMAKIASNPEDFDVVVTTNLYGDIVSDIVSLSSGSIGLTGSANIGDYYAMFEAVHGSAPDIAGKNVANPSGLLNAAVQMLVHIGQLDKAGVIRNAFLKTLEDGVHTADIYNEKTSLRKASTMEFAQAIVGNLGTTPQRLKGLSLGKETPSTGSSGYVRSNPKRVLVGVDVTVHWDKGTDIKELVGSLSGLSSELKLQLVYAKGLELWPKAPYSYTYVDLVSCRFYAEGKEEDGVDGREVGNLLLKMEDAGIDTVKMVKLYLYDGGQGFFTP